MLDLLTQEVVNLRIIRRHSQAIRCGGIEYVGFSSVALDEDGTKVFLCVTYPGPELKPGQDLAIRSRDRGHTIRGDLTIFANLC